MTNEQKKYLEDNAKLIAANAWEKFFRSAPEGTGALLYEAGISFLDKLDYIPESAFQGSDIQTIDIPNNVTNIKSYAFADCNSLISVTIPNSVTNIDIFAFYNCYNLKNIIIPDSVTNIDHSVFESCEGLESVTIGNSVKSIGDMTFYYCDSLTSITIPDSVTGIGGYAFAYCGQLEIKYSGTKANWQDLISSNNKDPFKNTTYICRCTDGVVKKAK